MSDKISIIGRRFGKLKVVQDLPRRKSPCGQSYAWSLCICDCGKTIELRNRALVSGNTRSCGCNHYIAIGDKLRKHGHSSVGGHGLGKFSPTYHSWSGMIQRCTNPKRRSFKNYGGRGIKICERWMKFENFLEDMGTRPIGKVLDRINNNGNYEPGNCQWATILQQANNKRTNRIFTVNGITGCMAELCRRFSISHSLVQYRLRKGFSAHYAFTHMVMRRKR